MSVSDSYGESPSPISSQARYLTRLWRERSETGSATPANPQ